MFSKNASNSAEKAKRMLAWALTESLEAPRDNETIVLPGYTIKETLGKGGMGTVYRAIHNELNRTVALKIFSPKAKDRDLFIERLKREGKLMAQLKHPNVLAIHDAAVMEDGTPYLVLEYINGEDLQQRLKEQFTLNHRTAVRIAIKICDALSAVHNLGIIHRDIKPANVLLDANGSVKVSDFGISKDLRTTEQHTSLTMTGTTVGTADYMSPEQTRNEELSPRSDLYSVGVLLYEMLMGVTPRGNFQSLRKARIPKKLEQIIMRCLQQDKNKRPASAETLAQSLRKTYHLLTTRKRSSNNPIIIGGIATTFAIGAIALVAYVSTHKPPPHQVKINKKPGWQLSGKINQWSPLTSNKPYSSTGGWWSDSENIYTEREQTIQATRFFNFSAGYNYKFSTDFTRIHGEGNMCLFLPTVKGLVIFELDTTYAHLTGFHSINGETLTQQKNAKPMAIKTGKSYQIEISVTTSEISATINNKAFSKITLLNNSLSIPPKWDNNPPFRLGIGTNSQSAFKNTKVMRTK